QATLCVPAELDDDGVEELIGEIDERLVLTADVYRDDFIVTVWRGAPGGVYSEDMDDEPEDDEEEEDSPGDGRGPLAWEEKPLTIRVGELAQPAAVLLELLLEMVFHVGERRDLLVDHGSLAPGHLDGPLDLHPPVGQGGVVTILCLELGLDSLGVDQCLHIAEGKSDQRLPPFDALDDAA